MKRAAILIAMLAMTGCQTQMRMLETTGDVRVEPSTAAGADYVVHLRNTLDFGYNPDDKTNRDRFALNYLKSQCPAGRIVRESVINTGTYGLGRPARIYSIYVKCS
ncbi:MULTISPECIES: hypothetical protein [Sinorhizobium]|uniref:hypothetical protein n=1 Tax=Sinorhizobium TaxID=28105 RepID=UPI00041EE71E|nr:MULTISPECIES: hypothetical protein [Sinorhizobium]MDW9668068.1 hypothetical protein [Sinorhizobium meliloti]MDW9740860.1 hypothetical protein [Sinorhizobium meliloti]MDW9984817.1 hypothetical protein [Sinorhizobium meliloti]MDX0270586.1 hypothetical protein [Sinorhizobium meliloti]RVG41677.1 hypothetical protein CN224_35325 [Sinorhizobium meliloti]